MRILYIAQCPSTNMGLRPGSCILSKCWMWSCIFKHPTDDSLKLRAIAVVGGVEFFPRRVSALSKNLITMLSSIQSSHVFPSNMPHNHVILCHLDYTFMGIQRNKPPVLISSLLFPTYPQCFCMVVSGKFTWQEYSNIRKSHLPQKAGLCSNLFITFM